MQIFYWVQLFCLTVTLSILGHVIVERFGGKPLVGALLFASLTPHFLGLIFLVLAFVWPGSSPFIFILVPLVICIPILIFFRHVFKGIFSFATGATLNAPLLLAIASFSLLIGYLIWERLSTGHTSHDISIYLAEARELAYLRNISALPQFKPALGQMTLTHPHLPTWSAFLAQALVFSEPESGVLLMNGFVTGDWHARMAVGFAFFCMVLAIFGLALVIMRPLGAFLATVIAVVAPIWGLLISIMSRDPFRTAPLLALIGILALCLSTVRLNKNVLVSQGDCSNLPMYLMVALTALAAASAHTINTVFIAAIGFAILLFLIIELHFSKILFKLCLAIFIGVLPVVAHHINYYVCYGHPLGLGMQYIFYTPEFDSSQQKTPIFALSAT